MLFCQICSRPVLQVKSGRCGGNGSIFKCTNCGQVYKQETGGFIPTQGGETYRPLGILEARIELGDK